MLRLWLTGVKLYWTALWQDSPAICIYWGTFQVYTFIMWSTKGYSMFTDKMWLMALCLAIIVIFLHFPLFLSAARSVGSNK